MEGEWGERALPMHQPRHHPPPFLFTLQEYMAQQMRAERLAALGLTEADAAEAEEEDGEEPGALSAQLAAWEDYVREVDRILGTGKPPAGAADTEDEGRRGGGEGEGEECDTQH